MDHLEDTSLLQEDLFPGNTRAFEGLISQLERSRITAFVGAGASVPLVSTWSQALLRLAHQARDEGKIDTYDLDFLTSNVNSDPLDAASMIEEAFGSHIFRAKMSTLFKPEGGTSTCVGKAIFELPIQAIVTTNYDNCLGEAYVQKNNTTPLIYASDTAEHLVNWRRDLQDRNLNTCPILHLHGVFDRPRTMIFTAKDYDRFYLQDGNQSFIQEVWKNLSFLVIGFSFTDPFLRIFTHNAVSALAVDSNHFAFIGHRGDHVSPFQRSTLNGNIASSQSSIRLRSRPPKGNMRTMAPF